MTALLEPLPLGRHLGLTDLLRAMLRLATMMKAARVKVPEREWHAMRHTFASQFMMAGGNILTLQKLLGHRWIDLSGMSVVAQTGELT